MISDQMEGRAEPSPVFWDADRAGFCWSL